MSRNNYKIYNVNYKVKWKIEKYSLNTFKKEKRQLNIFKNFSNDR